MKPNTIIIHTNNESLEFDLNHIPYAFHSADFRELCEKNNINLHDIHTILLHEMTITFSIAYIGELNDVNVIMFNCKSLARLQRHNVNLTIISSQHNIYQPDIYLHKNSSITGDSHKTNIKLIEYPGGG